MSISPIEVPNADYAAETACAVTGLTDLARGAETTPLDHHVPEVGIPRAVVPVRSIGMFGVVPDIAFGSVAVRSQPVDDHPDMQNRTRIDPGRRRSRPERNDVTTEASPVVYRVMTGPDDTAFCERVSAAQADGCRLHGPPSITFNGAAVIVAQALVSKEEGAP